jgi:serine/alanine adding enzyme
MNYLIIDTGSERLWRQVLPKETTVFGSVEFARIQEQSIGRVGKLIVAETAGGTVCYPVLLRSLSDLPFASCGSPLRYDAVTPEFTGPLGLSTENAGEWSSAVQDAFRELGVLSEFMHLHPWNQCGGVLVGGRVRVNREIVWVDTTLTDEQLWQEHYNHACRKNLKRAAKENVQVFEASTAGDIREFYRIYCGTMDRNDALASYYLPLSYFMAFFEEMRESSRFLLAEWRHQVIAATLYLHDAENIYSYLGGADYEFQEVRPTNAVIDHVIRWGRESGKRRLILGGGYRPDDGIFRFKASFSQLRAKFYTFQRIHAPEAYSSLTEKWRTYYGAEPNGDYFPTYRTQAPIAASAVAT